MNQSECHLSDLQLLADGNAPIPPQSLGSKLRHFVRRYIGHERSQKIHFIMESLRSGARKKTLDCHYEVTEPLNAGDIVRVRSKEEILLTLDQHHKLKGCLFMYEQQPYCNTEQRVLKVMERFVDERDLRVKKCKGIVLLEGVMCPGTRGWGRCDRACFMFWREEWLVKIKDCATSIAVYVSALEIGNHPLNDCINILNVIGI